MNMKENVYIGCAPETDTTLQINYTPIKFFFKLKVELLFKTKKSLEIALTNHWNLCLGKDQISKGNQMKTK